jgi:hypothetical protein
LLPGRSPLARSPLRRRAHRSCASAAALCLLVLLGAPAGAFRLTSIRPARDADQRLWVELRLEEVFEQRVAESLSRGMPATLTLRAELWRRRTGWFDRLERTSESTARLRRDVANETWRLERPGAAPVIVGSIDSLRIVLERNTVLPVGSLERLAPEAPCYVVVSAWLRPLSLEDVEEVEGWLSGEVKSKRSSGFGFLTGIPRSLFDAARNFAGFGDERTRLISTDFTPANLPPLGR